MGRPREDGAYPEGTVNRRIADRLSAFAEERTAFLLANDRGAKSE